MAIYYCDLISGNDANDGLTPSTPKLTLNAATALVAAATDEVKVCGYELSNFEVGIGNWTWIDGGNTITISGDSSSSVNAGDFVWKTVVLSGETVPEFYRVKTVAYAAGTNTTTITFYFYNTTYNHYYGVSETVATSKITPTAYNTAQTINKNGYLSGSATDLTGRTITQITGGWDSGFTYQSYTVIYRTTNGIAINLNSKTYWDISRFAFLSSVTNTPSIYYFNNSNYNNYRYISMAYSYRSTTGEIRYNYWYKVICTDSYGKCLDGNATYPNLFNECKMLNVGSDDFFGSTHQLTIINSVIGYNISGKRLFANSTSGRVDCINSIIRTYNTTNYISSYAGSVNFTGCTFQDYGTTANVNHNAYGNYINNIFDWNLNRTTAYVYGNTYPYAAYYFIGNSGATGQYMRHSLNGVLHNNHRFKLWQGTTTFNNLKWYNTYDEDLGMDDYTANNTYDWQSNNVIYNYTTGTTKNARLSKYGYTILSDDYYTGKTGTTGATNSILHIVSTNNAACDFSNVDFVIDKSTAYSLSFYAKGSGSYTLNWNVLNGGEFIYSSWQTQAITAGGWQQITKAISASDWKMSGTATLIIRIPSQAKGTYALIDYIQLT